MGNSEEFKHFVLAALRHRQKKKEWVIHAWVILPSHFHLIISSKAELLENIM